MGLVYFFLGNRRIAEFINGNKTTVSTCMCVYIHIKHLFTVFYMVFYV